MPTALAPGAGAVAGTRWPCDDKTPPSAPVVAAAQLLRDPRSGLWSQGRGWIEGKPAELSPGAWSRGHGWLLRGLTASLAAPPRESAEKAFAALPARVDERGVVLGTSPGPGPLETEAPYLTAEFRPGDAHGTFAVIFAAAEALRRERARQSGQR